MKILDLSLHTPQEIAAAADAPAGICPNLPSLCLATDSAAVLPGRPLFLPETAAAWNFAISPAVRISRLGKSIPRRFAHEHFDAITLVGRVYPQGLPAVSPWSAAVDSSYALGLWIPPTDATEAETTLPCESGSIPFPADTAENAIAVLSRLFTLKNGDIVVIPPFLTNFAAAIDTHVEATINRKPVLSFNLK